MPSVEQFRVTIAGIVDTIAHFLSWVASRLGDSFPVLLGGAGGVLIVWWLDGRRQRARERRSLTGALELVTSELAYNITQAHTWATLDTQPPDYPQPGAPPIEMRFMMWESNANELARALPRDLVARCSVVHYQMIMFNRNIAVAAKRGSVIENDMRWAATVRDLMQLVLRQLQAYERERLGTSFEVEPTGPTETDDSPWAVPRDEWKDAPSADIRRAAWNREPVNCPNCGQRVDPVRDLRHYAYQPNRAEPVEALVKHEACGAHVRFKFSSN